MSQETETSAAAPALEQDASISEQAIEGYHALEQRAGEIKETATELNNRAVTFIQENPAVAIAAAFGVGYFIGSMAARRWIV